MHDGEELPDVIRSLGEGPHLEDDPTRGQVHATVLHHTWIARAGSIDSERLLDGSFCATLHPRGGTVATGEALKALFIGSQSFTTALEGLEEGLGIALRLALTFRPGLIDPWLVSRPDDVPLLLLCHRLTCSWMKSFPAVSRRGSGAQKYNNPPCYRFYVYKRSSNRGHSDRF